MGWSYYLTEKGKDGILQRKEKTEIKRIGRNSTQNKPFFWIFGLKR